MAIQSNFPAIKPSLNLDFSNTKKLDGRITFTRASTATYYDGVTTAKAEENLLLQSQDFTTSWSNVATSDTADTTVAPDGTTTADTITATGTGAHYVQQTSFSTTGTQRVLSCFVKAGTNNFVQLGFGTSVTDYANFNVTSGAGAVGTVGATATASIVDAGNGWFRCIVITSNATASALCFIAIIQSSTDTRLQSFVAAGTETIILWGAQLEQRSSVTSYTATTTQPITNYVPVLLTAANNQPRFDHNPTTDESLGLLIEEQRTNLLLQSEDLDTTWAETRATLNLNSVVSPAGTLTADRLIASTDNNTHFTTQTFTGTAASYTFTVYAKASGINFIALRLFNGTSEVGLAYYNLSTGAVGTVTAGTATITAVGNGWYRCALTATLAASASCTADIYLASADNTNSFAGDAFDGVALWGFQTELGEFPTSYIATGAATVTRSADAASMTGTNFSSWYNQSEGTLFADGLPQKSNIAAQSLFDITDGTSNTRIGLIKLVTSGIASFVVRVSGVNEVVTDNGEWTFPGKLAGAYKVNDFAAVLNGTTVATDTSGAIPVVNRLDIGWRLGGVSPTILNGHIRRLAYYPLRLTNAQLQALTG